MNYLSSYSFDFCRVQKQEIVEQIPVKDWSFLVGRATKYAGVYHVTLKNVK